MSAIADAVAKHYDDEQADHQRRIDAVQKPERVPDPFRPGRTVSPDLANTLPALRIPDAFEERVRVEHEARQMPNTED